MNLFLILAWRNLWRNRQRTLITMSSIFFAVVLVLFIRSMQLGTYNHMVENTVKMSTGYIQIQANEFWEKRSLEQSFEHTDSFLNKLKSLEHVTIVTPRIESFALVSSGRNSIASSVIGIDPEKENIMNSLSDRIEKGSYFSSSEPAVLIPEEMARNLGVKAGDTLILISQGFHGISAAGAYPVSGILNLPLPDMNTGVIYMPLKEAQWFYGLENRITSLAVMIERPQNLGDVIQKINQDLPNNLTVMSWRQMMPELLQAIQVDNAGGIIMLGILYIVIAFGIFGTVMMMAVERKREFSILFAVGTKKSIISLTVLFETVAIAVLGTLTGLIISLPLLLYMRANPIRLGGSAAETMIEYGYQPLLPFIIEPSLFINQSLVVFLIALLASIYPVFWITRIKVSNALRA